MPVIGYLGAGWPDASTNLVASFRKGLSEVGYVEGRNVAIEFRWAHNENERLPDLAADLVRRGVQVIVTQITPRLQHLLQRAQPRRSLSSSASAPTRSEPALSPASIGRAATSLVSPR
jgi:hypothetical protein